MHKACLGRHGMRNYEGHLRPSALTGRPQLASLHGLPLVCALRPDRNSDIRASDTHACHSRCPPPGT
eukprot:355136-Chlamydomonas_euryale.AAC.14